MIVCGFGIANPPACAYDARPDDAGSLDRVPYTRPQRKAMRGKMSAVASIVTAS
jgi:hypothetical protein